jgi:hypothetical protein
MDQRSALRICRYLYKTRQTQETNIHAFSRVRTPPIPVFEEPQTNALDHTATGVGLEITYGH